MTGLKYFLGGFLCAVALIYIRDRVSAPPAVLPPPSEPLAAPPPQPAPEPAPAPAPALAPVQIAAEKPRIFFRGVAETGAVNAEGGLITVGVLEERVSYSADDKAADALTAEQKIPKFFVQLSISGPNARSIDIDCAEIPIILEGINRLPVPFIAHNDSASAVFRYNDRLVFTVFGAAGKSSKFEVAINGATLRVDTKLVELFKTLLKSAAENCDTRERWQRENASLKPRAPLKWN